MVVNLSRELSHCFQQDQDSEQLPVNQEAQGVGKCLIALQSEVLLKETLLLQAKFFERRERLTKKREKRIVEVFILRYFF